MVLEKQIFCRVVSKYIEANDIINKDVPVMNSEKMRLPPTFERENRILRKKVKNILFMLQSLLDPTQRKYFWRWFRSLQRDYLLTQKSPWITFNAIDFLETIDLTNKQVFEYGSGGSTLYWLSKEAFVVSVEHDHSWYNRLQSLVSSSHKWNYWFVGSDREDEVTLQHGQDPSNPDAYTSAIFFEPGVTYKTYASQIDAFPDNFFDVVLIDGRARPSCIKHSVSKVKSGGILILDNSDREHYLSQRTRSLLHSFEGKVFRSLTPQQFHMCETTIFLKP
jgi:hypothetical protein